MRRRKKAAPAENHERWLVSYADFITLLFAFFVMLYANSNVNKQKAQAISESFKEAIHDGQISAALACLMGHVDPQKPLPAPSASTPVDEKAVDLNTLELLPSLEQLNQQLRNEIKDGRLDVRLERRGLVISLREATFFKPADDSIEPTAYPMLERIAEAIRTLRNPVRLEGHTDAVPIHSTRFRTNWELSAARSIAMLELFSTRFGMNRERMAIAGFAENMPVAPNDTAEGRARNRRVDIVVLNEAGLRMEPPQAAGPAALK